jgi:hypothetical protein
MRDTILVFVTGAALTLGAAQSVASDAVGEIKRIEGSALVSKGEQFVAARDGMALDELDRLMVLEDSSALVAFADGCERRLGEKELLIVEASDMCAEKPASYEGVERTAQSQLEAVVDAGVYVFAGIAGLGIVIAATQDGSGDPQRREPFSPE